MSTLIVTTMCLGAAGVGAIRWLRVAQREHYEPGRVTVFALRWWQQWLAVALVAGVLGAVATPWLALLTAAAVAAGPLGLGLKGRSSALAWTRRLRTTAAVTAGIAIVVVAAGAVLGLAWPAALLVCAAVPVVVDAALAIAKPFEQRAARKFVVSAAKKLRQVDPTVIALTGSYGKTTTKGYLRHLIQGSRSVMASPASFNNTAGLSRAVNEHLSAGTEVFIAEMGAYGPGEIASLCEWVQPDITAIVAIGPVHLERYGTLDNIVKAKSEIVAEAPVTVLNVDAHGLAAVADRVEADGRRVIRVSTSAGSEADVVVTAEDDRLRVTVDGSLIGRPRLAGAHPSNVAAAVALALAAGIDTEAIAARLDDLPPTEHRQQVGTAPSGVVVVDDTFNSNPAGAAAALELVVSQVSEGGRAVVVTPGMIELGPKQHEENARFAEAASLVASDVVIVGRFNRAALLEGARKGPATVHTVRTRDEAVAWVRANLGAGDAVLYENDLPDHFP